MKVIRTLESGRELILHLWGPGGVPAEAPRIEAGPTPFTIVAQEDTSIYSLPRADFLSALEKEHVLVFDDPKSRRTKHRSDRTSP